MNPRRFGIGGLVGIFILGCTLLSYPVLTIFNLKSLVFGLPLLYLYVFVAWFIVIVLVYCVVKMHTGVSPPQRTGSIILEEDER